MLLGLLMDAVLAEVTRAVYPSRDYIHVQGLAGGGVLRPHPWARGRGRIYVEANTEGGRCCQGKGRLLLPIVKLVDCEEGYVEYAASDKQ